MREITLHNEWVLKAPLNEVFIMLTDFEKMPEHFPKVAESIEVTKRDGDYLEMNARVKSFGRSFPVQMKTHILPGRGFTSDNNSPAFGTSGHEELLLSPHPDGTEVDYTYHLTIHTFWLRIVATPLIKWYSMKFWEHAVIDRVRQALEK